MNYQPAREILLIQQESDDDLKTINQFIEIIKDQYEQGIIISTFSCSSRYLLPYDTSFITLIEGDYRKGNQIDASRKRFWQSDFQQSRDDEFIEQIHQQIYGWVQINQLKENKTINKKISNEVTQLSCCCDYCLQAINDSSIVRQHQNMALSQLLTCVNRLVVFNDELGGFSVLFVNKTEASRLVYDCLVLSYTINKDGECVTEDGVFLCAKKIIMEIERELIMRAAFNEIILSQLGNQLPITCLKVISSIDFY